MTLSLKIFLFVLIECQCFRITQFISDVAVTHIRQQVTQTRITLENIPGENSFS